MVSSALTAAIVKAATGLGNSYKSDLDNDTGAAYANGLAVIPTLVLAGFAETKATAPWVKNKPTVWLDNALLFLNLLDIINGISSPDRGMSLTDGGAAPNFDAAIANLRLCLPDDSQWSGDAAQAYSAVIRNIQASLNIVKEADADLRKAIDTQANAVMKIRGQFAYTKIGLMTMIPFAIGVYIAYYSNAFAVSGNAAFANEAAMSATQVFQGTVITAAMLSILGCIGTHLVEVNADALEMMSVVVGQYSNAVSAVPLLSQTAVPQKAAAAASSTTTVGAFQRPSGAKPYPVAGATGRSGNAPAGRPAQPVTPPVSPLANNSSIPTAPATPSAQPNPATPYSTPVTGQAGQTQPAGASGTSAANRSRKAAVPGEYGWRASGADTENAGAALGAEGAERAPIETPAVVSGQAQEQQRPTAST
jgi:hypothetical protein